MIHLTLNVVLQMLAAVFLPVVASAILYLLEKRTPFGKLNFWIRQAIYGVIFGGIAVFGTEFGVPIEGVVMNVRDAAPIAGGLIFGWPTGLIAGFIGGLERFIRAPWVGEYTKIACSVSTFLAGVFAAFLRKYMFDDRKPAGVYGLAAGVIMEVVHMLMVFLTNMNDARNSFNIVQKVSIPMIVCSGISVMLALIAVTLLSSEKPVRDRAQIKISQTFQRNLLICVLAAFLITSGFSNVLQTAISSNQTNSLLKLNLEDVQDDISDALDRHILESAAQVAARIEKAGEISNAALRSLSGEYGGIEINIVDEKGIIKQSTVPDYVGFDMSSGEQAAEFLCLLDGTERFVQPYQLISRDYGEYRKYAGIALASGGFVQVGYDGVLFQKDIADQVVGITRNRHIGESGFVIICDEQFDIVSDAKGYEGQNLVATGIWIDLEEDKEEAVYVTDVYEEPTSWMYVKSEGFYIIAAQPQTEVLMARNVSIYLTTFMEVLIFTALFIMVYVLIKRLIVNNISQINNDLGRITQGDLDVTVNVRSNEEFVRLSDDINSTVVTLKKYIAEASARIDRELEFAKVIQTSALPTAFPDKPGFRLWASTDPAKEVGGDFYDFYQLDDNRVAVLIADVSGKGIPAAMFMMTSKTMLKDRTESGLPIADVFTRVNEELCAANEAGMFVTAWMGVLELDTGRVTFVNAGHNPPVIFDGERFEYLRTRAGFVLAGMEGVRYRSGECFLKPGDKLFLYTDGVTEATDTDKQLYGEERLQTFLNAHTADSPEDTLKGLRGDIDAFVGEAEQFDDITMLMLEYKKTN